MKLSAALIACAGRWKGTSTLSDPEYGIDEVAATTADVVPLLGGRFVRIDYTWSYRGEPQEGMLLIGADPARARWTTHWIDSWHMGHLVMACDGPAGGGVAASGSVSVRGSYAAPPGPDWGWRIDVTPGPDALLVAMYNISPDGPETLAVESRYTRS